MRRVLLYFMQACLPFTIFSASAQNSALNLNGTSNFATMTNDVVSGSGDFTVEFWAYVPAAAAGAHQFVSQGTVGSGFAFYIGYDGSNANHIQAGDGWPDIGVEMPIGQWVHMAMTLNAGTLESNFYLDGVPVANTLTFLLPGGSPFQVGVQTDGTQFMNGRIDELRIWNSVRSQAQIKAGMFGNVDPATPGLYAYYNMNDGTGSSTVSNITSTTGLNGTLSDVTAWTSSPIQFGNNALSFDGIDDQVIIPASNNYDLANGSVEFWVNPTSLSSTPATILGNQGAGGIRYAFQVSASQIGIDNGSGFNGINYTLPLGMWTHLAFVNDGTMTTIYINGMGQPTTIPGGFGSATAQPLAVGISKTAGADANPFSGSIDEVRIWNMQRSSANIINYMNNAMSGNETNLNGLFSFDQGVSNGDNTGLITAIDNTPNNNHGTLTNFALSATSSNFSGHTLSAPLPVTLARFSAVRQASEVVLQWQTDIEQNSKDFTVERSFDGDNYSAIATIAAAGNSNSPRNYSFVDEGPGHYRNFYRLRQSDLDGKSTYSAVRVVTFSAAGNRLIWYATGERTVEVRLQQGDNENFTLLDLSGHILQQGRLNGGRTSISGLPAGIYLVKVFTAAEQVLDSRLVIP